jgi:hypothetical protein
MQMLSLFVALLALAVAAIFGWLRWHYPPNRRALVVFLLAFIVWAGLAAAGVLSARQPWFVVVGAPVALTLLAFSASRWLAWIYQMWLVASARHLVAAGMLLWWGTNAGVRVNGIAFLAILIILFGFAFEVMARAREGQA